MLASVIMRFSIYSVLHSLVQGRTRLDFAQGPEREVHSRRLLFLQSEGIDIVAPCVAEHQRLVCWVNPHPNENSTPRMEILQIDDQFRLAPFQGDSKHPWR